MAEDNFKDSLWVLYKLEGNSTTSVVCGVGKANLIMRPHLSNNEDDAYEQLKTWANGKVKVYIRWSLPITATQSDSYAAPAETSTATILAYSNDKKQCEEFHSDIVKRFEEKKRKVSSMELEKQAPQPKRTFSRKLTMEEEEEDMFKDNEPLGNDEKLIPVSGMGTSNHKPVSINNTPVQSTLSQSSVTSEETVAINVEFTSQEVDLLAEIEKRDEKVKKLEYELTLLKENGAANKNTLDATNLERLISSAVEKVLASKMDSTAVTGLVIDDDVTNSNGVIASNRMTGEQRNPPMTFLVEGHALKIEKSKLKIAVSIGSQANSTKNLNGMVSKIMESVYSRQFMSERSLSGRPPRVPKNKVTSSPSTPTKKALPENDVIAIILFVLACWKKWYNVTLEKNAVRAAMRVKLSTEHRGSLKNGNLPDDEELVDLVRSSQD